MEISIIEVKNKDDWDSWLNNNKMAPFAQSWEWGNILMSEGKKIERLAVKEENVVAAQAQVIYYNLPFGWKYAFCPKGPIINYQFSPLRGVARRGTISNFQLLYNAFVEYLRSKRCLFFRIEPPSISNIQLSIKKTIDINPPVTLIMDLTQPEEQISQMMHPKTRYNIHLAEKKGVKIEEVKDGETFWKLAKMTSERDKFRLHAPTHYREIINSPLSRQMTAFYGNQPIASVILFGFGKTLTYLYGASDNNHRNVMAPHLLQWEAVRLGRQLGFTYYDFFGVAPRQELTDTGDGLVVHDGYIYDPTHQYAGVTRFKLGFGGVPYEDPGTWDWIIDKKRYRIYEVMRKLRRLI